MGFHNRHIVFRDDCADPFGFLEEFQNLFVSILVKPPSAANQRSHVLPNPTFKLLWSVDYASDIMMFARQSCHFSAGKKKTLSVNDTGTMTPCTGVSRLMKFNSIHELTGSERATITSRALQNARIRF